MLTLWDGIFTLKNYKCMDIFKSCAQGTTYIAPCIVAQQFSSRVRLTYDVTTAQTGRTAVCGLSHLICSAQPLSKVSISFRHPLRALCGLIHAKYFGKEAMRNSTWPLPWTSLWFKWTSPWNVNVGLSLPLIRTNFIGQIVLIVSLRQDSRV